MRKQTVLVILLFLIFHRSSAQYATIGSGALKDVVWWFNWAGFNVSNGASRTFNTTDGLTVTISVSNVSSLVPVPDVMNTWNGAVLHLLYDFTDPSIKPALHSSDAIGSCSFSMSITASRGGVPVPFTFIAADAEASTIDEVTVLKSNGSNWQTIDFFRNSSQTTNPLSGCNTQTVKINQTYGNAPQTGENPVVSTNSSSGNLNVDVEMQHNVFGGMAVAFGILAPIDRGDLPSSYGTAQHQLTYDISNPCNYLPPFPSASPSQLLHIGSVPGDADGYQTADDNATGVDEEGVTSFPVYDRLGNYSVKVNVANTTGSNAYLAGWFDYNRNGAFDNGEQANVVIPNNATSATLTWTLLPQYLPVGTANGYGFRFRISSDIQVLQSPTGYLRDGEVEDYFVTSAVLCAPMRVSTIADTNVCASEPVQLNTTGDATQYSWNTGNYLNNTNIASPIATPLATTTYIVTGSNPQACEAKDTVTITVNPSPAVSISQDVTICPGANTQLSAVAPGAVSYRWSPQAGLDNAGISNPVASPSANTEYVVLVKGSNQCTAKDSVKVSLRPPSVFNVAPAQPSICKQQSVVLTASGGDDYTWLSADNSIIGTSPAIEVQPDSSQVYRVQIKDVCQATSTLSVPVTVNELPVTAVTSSNDIDCSTGQAVLHVTGGSRYAWDSLPGLTAYNSANPVVTPVISTTYYVTVTGSNGCSKRDSVNVVVDVTKALSKFPVANAFTPNNDGKNDCFGLKYWSRITSLQFEVFNRWGQRVFYTSDPAACWDGTYNGTPQPPGGYIFQIKATTICGTATRKGIVMLIR